MFTITNKQKIENFIFNALSYIFEYTEQEFNLFIGGIALGFLFTIIIAGLIKLYL